MGAVDFRAFSPEAARANAERFDVPVFGAAMRDAVARAQASGKAEPG